MTSLSDWLKEEAKIRVEAMEMGHGVRHDLNDLKQVLDRFKYRKTYTVYSENDDDPPGGTRTKPCSCCGGSDHKIWKCRLYRNASADERWRIAKERRLCFRCLGNDHQGKDCRRSQKCKIDGLNHHTLLHNPQVGGKSTKEQQKKGDEPPGTPREGANDRNKDPRTITTCSEGLQGEYSLRTIPVWVKANGKKVKN